MNLEEQVNGAKDKLNQEVAVVSQASHLEWYPMAITAKEQTLWGLLGLAADTCNVHASKSEP